MRSGRPASIYAHFVGRSTSGQLDVDVDINRTTQVATSTTVRLTQDGRPVLVATVWGIDDDLDGLTHHTAQRPSDIPTPAALPTFDDRTIDRPDLKRHPFWSNLDQRPVTWIDDWEHRTEFEPERQAA